MLRGIQECVQLKDSAGLGPECSVLVWVLSLIVLCHVGNRNLSGEMVSMVGVLGTYPGVACIVLNLVKQAMDMYIFL